MEERRRRGVILNQWPQWKGIIFWFRSGILCIFWLPGTSANCLQCLSLCLLGVCVRRFLWDTHCRRLWLAPNTTHTLVLLLCKWIIQIIVSTQVSPFGSFFPPHDKHWLLDWCYWLSRLVSHIMWNPPPPPSLCLYEGPKTFQSLVFYIYQSNVRNGGC